VLEGEGMPIKGGPARGDLLVQIAVRGGELTTRPDAEPARESGSE